MNILWFVLGLVIGILLGGGVAYRYKKRLNKLEGSVKRIVTLSEKELVEFRDKLITKLAEKKRGK